MLIGVTGTIGAGKSLVAGELARQLGGLLFDADKQCRDLMEPGETGYRRSWSGGEPDFSVVMGVLIAMHWLTRIYRKNAT
jgi:hypothetical protein